MYNSGIAPKGISFMRYVRSPPLLRVERLVGLQDWKTTHTTIPGTPRGSVGFCETYSSDVKLVSLLSSTYRRQRKFL